jgi:CHASE2 domain-containing sensor protein/signal transduction histidine kinase
MIPRVPERDEPAEQVLQGLATESPENRIGGTRASHRTLWVSAALALLALALGFLNGLGRADAIFLDGLTRLNERRASNDIVIVAVDAPSLRSLGRWPWRRSVHAELMQQLARYRPAVVGLDFIFSEPALEHPEDDLLLATAILRGPPVVLPVIMELGSHGPEAVLPTPSIQAAVSGNGHIQAELDQDGTVRTVFLREGVGGKWWDHLSLAMFVRTPAGVASRHRLPGERRPEASPHAPAASAGAWQRDYALRIPFAGPPGHFTRVSYIDVLDGVVAPSVLAGKSVLVGVTAAGLGDGYPTPVSGHGVLMPGVELHANVLDALIRDVELSGAAPWQNALFTVVPLVLALLSFHKLRTGLALLALPVLMLAVLLAGYIAQRFAGVQFAPAAAMLALGISYPLWSWQRLIAAVEYLAEEVRRTKSADGLLLARETRSTGDALQHNMQAMKEAIDHLRELRQFVADSLNGLPDATLVTDGHGTILLANTAAERLCRSSGPAPLKGRFVDDALARLCGTRVIWPQFDGRHGEQPTDVRVIDIEAVSLDGRDLLIKFSPWIRTALLRSGWIVSLIDISGVRDAERQRDEAMRFITHDMRAPQASIVATIDLHRRGQSASVEPRLLDRIEQYALRTLALADEFTRLAQVENRNPAVRAFGPVDLSGVVIQAADQFWELARARDVRIDTTSLDPSEALTSGDESMLIRAVGNLISNAVKFSPAGGEVSCALTLCDATLAVAVRDKGPGISAEDQQHLFEKFRRFRPSSGEQPDGIGLGLAYVKAVAVRHGGTIEIQSQPGCGATFILKVPALKTAFSNDGGSLP